MNFAREENITQIMVFKQVRKRWRDLFFRNLADEILRYSGEIDVYVMTGSLSDIDKRESTSVTKKSIPWKAYGISIAIIAFTTIINFFLFPHLNSSNLVMVYLLGVTFVALLGEMGPSILASVVSVLAYDFFFIPPYYSFTVDDIEYFFTLIVMLVVAQVISQLTLLTQRQAAIAQLNENQISVLYTLSHKLSSTRGMDKLLDSGISYIANIFKSDVLALIPQKGHLVIQASSSSHNQTLDEKERGVAQWVYEMQQKAGFGTDSLSFSKNLYLPLLGTRGILGVLRIYPVDPDYLSSPEQIQLLEACVNQIALALEVDRLQINIQKD